MRVLAGEKATHPIWPLDGDDGRLHRSYPLAGILNHWMEFLPLTRRAACAACGLRSSVGGGIRRREVVYLTVGFGIQLRLPRHSFALRTSVNGFIFLWAAAFCSCVLLYIVSRYIYGTPSQAASQTLHAGESIS